MKRKTTSILLFLVATGVAAVATADHGHEHHERRRKAGPAPAAALAGPDQELYRSECGACHLAYPPGLLPARSWTALMGGLDDHFAQNAELDAATQGALTAWLVANSAETGSHPRSKKALRGVKDSTPSRISTLPYILRKHHELRSEVFERASVLSRANCGACHQGAEQWVFEEDRARIPPR